MDKIIKAAIYTRKSSEEGLREGQVLRTSCATRHSRHPVSEFNSLDAQREACESYIKSQKHEGWELVDKIYSDGGVSGGTLERPALKELIQDIKDGIVNMIVVYKIDRLTRSLHDFSKLVEIFDTHKTSFVSITQQFNTSTSMGRLTLNMLLSFAQFEREVTGERIRDKKLASAKKGLWVHGTKPFGYKVVDRRLVPDTTNSTTLKLIFEKYLELGSVIKLSQYLKEMDILTINNKNWRTGALYHLLSNKVYIGLMPHKDQVFEGTHEPIVTKELFNKVQKKLLENHNAHRVKSRAKEHSPLAGLLFDDAGNKLYPSHSTKKNGDCKTQECHGGQGRQRVTKRYRYYKSKTIAKHNYEQVGSITQISAPIIESTIQKHITQELQNPKHIEHCQIEELQFLSTKQKEISLTIENTREVYLKLIHKITLTPNNIEIQHYPILTIIKSICYKQEISNIKQDISAINILNVPIKLSVSKNGATAIIGELEKTSETAAQHILETTRLSFQYNKWIQEGKFSSAEELSRHINKDGKYIRSIMSLRFLAPQILERILSQNIPSHWTLKLLFQTSKIDNWSDQLQFIS